MREAHSIWGVVFLRVFLGLWLIWSAMPHLDRHYLESLSSTLESFTYQNPYQLYRWFILQIFIPHAASLATFLAVGQFLTGCAIVIGFLVQFVSLLGCLMALNLFLLNGHLDFFHQSFSVLLLLAFLTLIFGDAGQYYGLDGLIFKEAKAPAPKKTRFKTKKQRKIVEALNDRFDEDDELPRPRRSKTKFG